eukprot:g70441.t1
MTSSLATLRSKFPIPIKSKSARQCFLLRLVLCLSFVRYSLPFYLIAMPQFNLCLNNCIYCDLVPVPTVLQNSIAPSRIILNQPYDACNSHYTVTQPNIMPLSAAGHDPKVISTDKKYATKVGCKVFN